VIDPEAEVEDDDEEYAAGWCGARVGLYDGDVRGGGDSADAMDWDTSERSRDARLWLLVNLSLSYHIATISKD
jgi:hypothetical protein